MFKFNKFLLISLGLFYSCCTFADDASAQDLWLQATSDTRAGAAAVQNQIMANKANQQNYQQQQQQQILQALTSMQLQQKAILDNSIQRYPTGPSTFQALPAQVPTGNNPWVKPNPWQNTQQNSHPGNKYPYGGQPIVPSTGATVPALNSANTIYVAPNNTNVSSPAPAPQNSNMNIYK